LERQRVQWFDSEGRLLSEQGTLSIPPLPAGLRLGAVDAHWQRWPGGSSLWQVVRRRDPRGERPGGERLGFVRVALSDQAAREDLARLRRGLLLGGIVTTLAALLVGRRMLRAAFLPLQRQLEALRRFTADASHELRHPLTAIRALIGTLRHGELLATCPPQMARKLQQIDQSVDRMGRLLEDLLLLSRSDRAIDESSGLRPIPLEDLVEDLLDLHQAEAEAAGLQLRGCLRGGARVSAHPERLRMLLENLLANALRFSPPGGTVTVGLEPRRDRVRLWVDDQGPGIPPEQRAQVFERFWQADGARSSADHHGLGLSIAEAIATAHRGRLQVESAPGGGCRMVLELPLLP
jgi:signal transduction histidine kinase